MSMKVYDTMYSASFAADVARVMLVTMRMWITRNALFPEKTKAARANPKYSFVDLCALDVMSRATEAGIGCYLGARLANTLRDEFAAVINDYQSGRRLTRTIAVVDLTAPDDDDEKFQTNTTGPTPWVSDDQSLRLTVRRPDGHARYGFGMAFVVDLVDVIDRVTSEIVARTPKPEKLRPMVKSRDATL